MECTLYLLDLQPFAVDGKRVTVDVDYSWGPQGHPHALRGTEGHNPIGG